MSYHKSSSSSHYCRKHTITTGPFLVPFDAPSGGSNNRLIILIKNPTNKPLEANIAIEFSEIPQFSIPGITLPYLNTLKEEPFPNGIGPTTILPKNILRLEVDITNYQNAVFHVNSTGDYLIGDDRPLRGKLEIEVIGGVGLTSPTNAGLIAADPSLIFHYGDFIV
ncbi:hypothetical protein AVT_02725 [Bacillus tropicus]|uniref:Uncharacterized protein n=1 Tax=Bacillus shihchuchen TaxID=3036942 RepID=A0ABT7KW98_9BACI|nr:hypothetical protein [Bacillus tropicus]MDL2418127.1 hypothetical protein [Bacillus shihchuchen]WBO90874.1 hypothetical protein AVT_02725 [Bacillus tropicus]